MAEKQINFRELTEDELRVQYQTFKEELFNLRFQLATGQLENTARLKTVRRNIARVMTYMQQAELKRTETPAGVLPRRKQRRRVRRALARRQAVARVRSASKVKA